MPKLRRNFSWCDLRGARFRGADLRQADFSWADIRRTNLGGADLRGANLLGAKIDGANFSGVKGYIIGPQRSDGYRFDLRLIGRRWCVVAGCNTPENWTIAQYRKHVRTYGNKTKEAETLAILNYLASRLEQVKHTTMEG